MTRLLEVLSELYGGAARIEYKYCVEAREIHALCKTQWGFIILGGLSYLSYQQNTALLLYFKERIRAGWTWWVDIPDTAAPRIILVSPIFKNAPIAIGAAQISGKVEIFISGRKLICNP